MRDTHDGRSTKQRPPHMPAAPFRRAVKPLSSERTSASVKRKPVRHEFVNLAGRQTWPLPWVWLAPRGGGRVGGGAILDLGVKKTPLSVAATPVPLTTG